MACLAVPMAPQRSVPLLGGNWGGVGGPMGGCQQIGLLVDVAHKATVDVPVPQEKEMPETFVVSDVVEGTSVEVVTLVPRERAQQWTSEQSEDFPQLLEEVVDAVKLVSQERVQQREN